jgi:hypothetical protein
MSQVGRVREVVCADVSVSAVSAPDGAGIRLLT